MDVVLNYFRTLPKRQVVRPWALAVPILVLLVALPLLRPLRSPEPESISTNELSRLATIQSLGDDHTQEINRSPYYAILRTKNPYHAPETAQLGGRVYSDKAPVLQLLLAGAYAVIARFGVTFDT